MIMTLAQYYVYISESSIYAARVCSQVSQLGDSLQSEASFLRSCMTCCFFSCALESSRTGPDYPIPDEGPQVLLEKAT